MKKLFLSAFASIIIVSLYAQDSSSVSQQPGRNKKTDKKDRINNMLRMEEEGDLIFNKHSIFGIRLASDGYGINYEKGKFKTPSKTLLYEFELNEKKSPKEAKQSISQDEFGGSLVPFKLNNFYIFKMAIGQQQLIGGKGNKNGVAVTALYAGGVSIGMLKPYYLDIGKQGTSSITRMTVEQFLQDTDPTDQVTGASGFTVGWGHLKVKPGLNAKQALRFDYGRLNQTVSAIEAGLTEEFYFSKIPQVYLVPQKQLFFNAYVSILFGSRK